MANGYLGKISAIVSANTADFDGKLGRSAKEVNAFAGRVQSNLTSASRQAAKALEGIYTPLQKFERSLQAAGSLKLSFKGFPGMIKDLDTLQQRLNSALSQRQVDIVLKTTGMSSVSALQDAIRGLKSKDVEVIARLGGLDKLKELKDKITVDADVKNAQAEIGRLTAVAEAAKAKVAAIGSVPVTVKVNADGVDALKTELDGARVAAGKLMGGEFMGDKALNKAIDGNITQLALLDKEISRVAQNKKTLETMSAGGPRTKPEVVEANRKKLDDTTNNLSSLGTQREDLKKNIADLEKYRDTIKKLMRDIKQAEAGGGGAATDGGDIVKANKEKDAAIRAVTRAAKDLQKQIAVKYGVDIDISSLNELIARGAKAGDVLGTLGKLAENLGKSDFDVAADRMRKLQSVASQITAPLEAGVKKLGALSVGMAAAYHPALKGTQRSVEQLNEAIEKQVKPSPNLEKFLLKVQAQAENAIKTFDRMVEVSSQIGQVKTGKEFVFEQPRLNEAINKGGDIGNRAAALPAAALQTNPAIAKSLVEIRRLSDEASVAYAKFLSVKDQRQPTGAAQKELDGVVKKLLEAQAVAERQIKVVLDTAEAEAKATALKAKITALKQDVAFTVTGKVQNFDQARGEMARLQAEMGKLDATQRAPIARKIVALGKLVEAGDVDSLETVRNLIQQIEKAVGKKLRVSLDKAQAQKAADELTASLAKFKESISFTITGKVQNLEQARSELGRLQSDVDKLTEPQKIAIAPQLQKLGELVAGNQVKDLEQVRKLIAEIAAQAGSDIKLNLDTAEAEAKATELKAKIVALKENVTFTVTGRVQNIDQARSELARLQGDLGKLDESQRKPIAGNLVKLGKIVEAGDVTSLDTIRKLITQIENTLGKKLSVNLMTDQAEKAATELKGRLDALRTDVKFSVIGSFGNGGQIEAEVSRITADIQKLDATQKAAFGQRATLVLDLLGDNKIQEAAIDVKNLRADIDQQMEIKVKTTDAQKAIDDLKTKMAQAREQTAFVVTGRPQNMAQAESRRASIDSDVATLDRSQRQNVKPLLEAADVARATGDVDKVNDALDKLAFKVAQEKRVNVTTAEAKKNLDDLKVTMDSLMDESNFVISAKVQNAGQAESEIKRIIGGMEQLDAAQSQALQPKVNAAIASLGMKDAKTGLPDIAAISAAMKDLDDEFEKERVIKVRSDDAQKSVDELKASLGSIADKIGDPSQPIDRLRQAVEAANAAIAKMPAGAIKTKLEGDLNSEKVRIEAAARPGAPAPSAAGIDEAAARANAIAASATAATPAKATANPLGADFGTAERSIASLQSNVTSLQSSLEKLPLPMQAQFIPAINEVRDEFKKLTLSSTAAEIDAVVNKAKTLEGAFTRAGQAAKFGGTLGEALNEAAITRTEKRLGFVRAKLLEVGATASGPVANAFNAYSAAAAAAASAGVSGTAATTKQLDGLIAKIGEALVAEGKLTAVQGKAFNKNVGDVGRGGADKFALGLNQAAFAIDDFMSSTGGLEFKLRAISNNITQLGFVVGGTTGLFVGLGAVIAGQAAIGLIKWINDGRSAEDQTKALNDALARQKGLVEELVQAYKSLGDSLSQGTFSAGADQARSFSRQLEDAKDKQKAIRRENLASVDVEVQKERGNQVSKQKKLEASTDAGERVGLQTQINLSKNRERGLVEQANRVNGVPPRADAVRESLLDFGRRQTAIDQTAAEGQAPVSREQKLLDGIASQFKGGNSVADLTRQLDEVKTARSILAPQSQEKLLGVQTRSAGNASTTLKQIETFIASIEAALETGIVDSANNIIEASRRPAALIARSQEDVAEAIRRGVPGAAQFQQELDGLSKRLADAQAKIEGIANFDQISPETKKKLFGKETLSPEERQGVLEKAQGDVSNVADQRSKVISQTRELRLGRTFGGQRAEAALSSIQGNERFKNELAGITAKLAAAIDAEVDARKLHQEAVSTGTAAEIDAAKANLDLAQKASEAAAALADAAMSIESALTRVRKVGDSALQRSEQGADAAQQSYTNSPLRAGAKEARDAAERRLINDRAEVGTAQSDLDNRRSQIQYDPRMVGINDELETITQRRKDLEAKRATSGGLNLGERDELGAAAKREIELIRQREMAARDLTAGEQEQLDVINSRIAAREKELEVSRRRSEESPEFSRIRSQSEGVLGEASRRADEAQQRFANNPTDENKQRRDEAEDNLRKRQSRLQRFQDMADASRKQIEASPDFQQNNKELQQIAERRAQIAESSAGRAMTEDEIGELTGQGGLLDREKELRGKNEGLMQKGLEPFRNGIDDAQKLDALRNRADRGRDLGMTDQERFREEFTEGAGADINARAKEMRDKGENPAKFLRQALANQMEQVAPMLKGFQDERQTAALQGPSRAALNVSDVSTSQGASELTRLLRGDDSAKDVNLAELRKQSGKLDEVVRAIERANPGVLL